MERNFDVIIFILKYSFLRKPRVAISVDIIKIVTMFIETMYRDSKEVKRKRNYISKCNLYLHFLI